MRSFIITLGCSMMICAGVRAQITVTKEVNEAIQQAIHKDVEVKNQHIELNKMELERQSVRAKYIPKVEARALYAHFNSDVTVDVPTNTVPLPSGGGINLFEGEQTSNNYGNIFHGGVTAKAVLFSGGQIYHGYKALEQKNVGYSPYDGQSCR